MKRLAHISMLIGLFGFLFGLGSCYCPARDERTFKYEDADANGAPYITAQRFISGMIVGSIGMAVGVYLRSAAKQKNNETKPD